MGNPGENLMDIRANLYLGVLVSPCEESDTPHGF